MPQGETSIGRPRRDVDFARSHGWLMHGGSMRRRSTCDALLNGRPKSFGRSSLLSPLEHGLLSQRAGGSQHGANVKWRSRKGLTDRSKNRSRGYVADGRVAAASSRPAATHASSTSSEQK